MRILSTTVIVVVLGLIFIPLPLSMAGCAYADGLTPCEEQSRTLEADKIRLEGQVEDATRRNQAVAGALANANRRVLSLERRVNNVVAEANANATARATARAEATVEPENKRDMIEEIADVVALTPAAPAMHLAQRFMPRRAAESPVQMPVTPSTVESDNRSPAIYCPKSVREDRALLCRVTNMNNGEFRWNVYVAGDGQTFEQNGRRLVISHKAYSEGDVVLIDLSLLNNEGSNRMADTRTTASAEVMVTDGNDWGWGR